MTAAAAASACVGADELVGLLEGCLPADRADALDAHVDGCASCAAVVAELGALADGAPRRVGRYLLERTLGVGGMGVVWAAWDPELQRRVAVKLVRPRGQARAEATRSSEDAAATDAIARARMVREARALARINHPNVVAVHDVGEHDGQVFVATELVDGETMARWQLGRGWREVVGAWVQAARGLAAAHAEGLVHRDVKPANVFVGRDGRVRVGDFGLARADVGPTADTSADAATELAVAAPPARAPAAGAQLTAAGLVAGTPGYMAPEQRRGPVDARADQFALCVAVVEALTGQRPEAGARPAIRDVPEALIAALERGLVTDPAGRFPTVAALGDALAAAASAAGAAPGVAAGGVAPAPARAPWIAIAIAVSGAALAAGAVVLVARPGGEPSGAGVAPGIAPGVGIAPGAGIGPGVAPGVAPGSAPTGLDPRITPSVVLYATFTDKAGQDAVAARQGEDPRGCLRALGGATAGEPPPRRVLRATCEMMAGACAEGLARIRAGFAPGPATELGAQWIERLFCVSTDGDLATRVRRFEAQAVNGSRLGFALDRYVAQLEALVADPGVAAVPAETLLPADDGPTVVGKAFLRIVPHLRSLRRCDAAARLTAKAAAIGVHVPADAFQNCR